MGQRLWLHVSENDVNYLVVSLSHKIPTVERKTVKQNVVLSYSGMIITLTFTADQFVAVNDLSFTNVMGNSHVF